MRSDKDRLYVALYARAGAPKMPGLEDTYHWAFIVGPKTEPNEGGQGTRFHAKNISRGPHNEWVYEERGTSLEATHMLLVRVMIGKVKDMERLRSIFAAVPVRGDEPGWNCVGWLKEALESVQKDGKALGTSVTDWTAVRDTAMKYVQDKKEAHRFDGKAEYDTRRPSTWDMLIGQELRP